MTTVETATCKWEYDEYHDKWDTSCNNAFVLEFGTPAEHQMKFCPYCGKPIKEIEP